jgi:serine/threonine-protein phosphatase with EF-hand domain
VDVFYTSPEQSFSLGHILLHDWCDIVTHVLELQLPWRTLKSRLVDIDSNGMVAYESTFRSRELQCALKSDLIHVSLIILNQRFIFVLFQRRESLCQAIYRNKDLLETVFRAIDQDNSGIKFPSTRFFH